MGFYCAVPLCKNNSRTKNSIHYHSFPRNPLIKKEWAIKIRRDCRKWKENRNPFSVSKYSKVCSQHFDSSDYINWERGILRRGAVPSLNFLWNIKERILKRRTINYKNGPSEQMESDIKVPSTSRDIRTLVTNNTVLGISRHLKKSEHDNRRDTELILVANNTKTSAPENENNIQLDEFKRKVEWLDSKLIDINNTILSNIFSCKMIGHDDKLFKYYTSLDFAGFNIILDFLAPSKIQWQKKASMKLSFENQFFLVLIKLRCNFGYQHLSKLFMISIRSVCDILVTWLNFLFIRFGNLNVWPHRDVILENTSDEFKKKYKNVIGSLDCTEIFIQTPASLLRQSQVFSNYKNAATVKGLVVIDNNGGIIFASPLFSGTISDNKIVESSEFDDILKEKLSTGFLKSGDIFLADKGFKISELVHPIQINTPIFKTSNQQFTYAEMQINRHISQERIHVERVMARIKSYKILSEEININLAGTINQIWTVCCMLCNFRPAIKKQ